MDLRNLPWIQGQGTGEGGKLFALCVQEGVHCWGRGDRASQHRRGSKAEGYMVLRKQEQHKAGGKGLREKDNLEGMLWRNRKKRTPYLQYVPTKGGPLEMNLRQAWKKHFRCFEASPV